MDPHNEGAIRRRWIEMASQQQSVESDEYRVRSYEPGDRDGVLSLFERQWGYRPGTDWFDWKYVDDPYLSHVPITLAEQGGEIVAVQGYVPCRLRRGGRIVRALKPVDAVVHPDHRRQGLYSRITELGIERYRDREAALFFNFPNEASLGAQEKLGWSEVTVVSMYYRVQRPGELLPAERSAGPLSDAADAIAQTALGVYDRLSPSDGDYEIERYASPPADLLASVYDSRVPNAFHAHREARYYRWLLEAPSVDHTAYVARQGGRPVAALVTRSDDDGVLVFDAVPLGSAHEAFADLLAAVVADNADACVLSVTARTLPSKLLARFGFVSYETAVVSRFCDPTYMAVRPLAGDDEDESIPFSRRALADPSNWCLSFLEVKD
ncbi:GNAT family N-acetyltransferase [Halopiger xanaduensis]|uniref:GCN5-related N-acetyltransferase n=1 Tax=Halopiger xanaduensis (strain DSM 18323 / JCM 14033 / SH-6) TaxID=797210 RepID=F8DCR3_HALXS|nr:GNAT family N-acetyltransferase [Halopiger xanaduensis]AEH37237.1 GCN5-related N-acetyltransferase [Halopiger xanaduensis SH-6]